MPPCCGGNGANVIVKWLFNDAVFSDFVQSETYFRRSDKVNFSFEDDCCKKISTPVSKA